MGRLANRPDKRAGIAVLGTVAEAMAKALDEGMPGVELVAVKARDKADVQSWLAHPGRVPEVLDFSEMGQECDIVVEWAPAHLLAQVATPVGRADKSMIVLSCGALLDHPELIDEAAKDFPANLNVAVILSPAGVSTDRSKLEIWADTHISRNTHTIRVESDAATLSMSIENIPTENSKMGCVTAQSVLALLRMHNAPMRVGT